MNIIECNVNGLKNYELEIWLSGVCKNLCGLKQLGNKYAFDCSGLCNISEFLKLKRKENVTEGFRRKLLLIIKLTEAELAASKYLIDNHSLSLDPAQLWMDKDGKIVFQPGCSEEVFFERLCRLADLLDASEINTKLRAENAKTIMNEYDILSFLSTWELELR